MGGKYVVMASFCLSTYLLFYYLFHFVIAMYIIDFIVTNVKHNKTENTQPSTGLTSHIKFNDILSVDST